jgi:hypothetical protein
MRTVVKDKKKGLKSDNLGQLQSFIGKLKKGEAKPFSEKTERARQNLKKSGLIE